MVSRKKLKIVALILSGIGGAIYLFYGLILPYYYPVKPSVIITGVISLIGTGIGVKKIKIGGIIILISIPLSLVLGTIIYFNPYTIFLILFTLLVPWPPHSVCVIIGGILCVISSDE